MTERWRSRPQTARARVSNPVSRRQCHFIHFTIFRMFSGPSLVNVHKGGLKHYSFHFLPVFLLSYKHPFTQTQCLPPLFLKLRRRICFRLPLFIYTDVESVHTRERLAPRRHFMLCLWTLVTFIQIWLITPRNRLFI